MLRFPMFGVLALLVPGGAQFLKQNSSQLSNETSADQQAADQSALAALRSLSQWQWRAALGLVSVVAVAALALRCTKSAPLERGTSAAQEELTAMLQESQAQQQHSTGIKFKMRLLLKRWLGNKRANRIIADASSGTTKNIKLAFELLVLVMCLFYLDFILDIQACITFYQTNNPRFLMMNLSAMFAAAVYTAYHVFVHGDRLLADLSRQEVFTLGVAYVFQLHVVYLCWISWKRGKKHQLLIDSKFAEAAIEAVVSALVQTYAVIFGAATLSGYQQLTLYVSILGSLASISNAFSLFDSPSGLDEAPGNVGQLSPKLLLVNAFRLSELTQKISLLALFQLAFRPFGGCLVAFANYVLLTIFIWCFQGQASFALPCMFALINPMLEKYNAVTLPHSFYYAFRALETAGLVLAVCLWRTDLQTLYQHAVPAVTALLVCTISMALLLPVIRCLAWPGLADPKVYTMAEWTKKPFSAAQHKLREAVLAGPERDTAIPVMLAPARRVLEVAVNINKTNLDAFMQEVGEEAISQSLSPPPTEFMRKALHVMGNTPLEEDSKLRQGLLRFALQTLNDHPSLMIRVFVESKGIDAAANLILKECALTWDGLQSLLPEDIRNSFLCASSTLLRQADGAALQGFQSSPLARAMAAAVLEHKMEPKLMKEVTVALGAVFSGVPQRHFTESGLCAAFSGALAEGSLELLCAVPMLFDLLQEDVAVNAHLRTAAAHVLPSLCQMLQRLDAQATPRAPSMAYQPLKGNAQDALTVVESSIQSLLRFLARTARYLSSADASSCSYYLQSFLSKSLQSEQEERQNIAQQVQLLAGAKGLTRHLEDADLSAAKEPLLQVAAEAGSLAGAEALLRHRALPEMKDVFGCTALHSALAESDVDILRLLHSAQAAAPPEASCDAGHSLKSFAAAGASCPVCQVRLGLWRGKSGSAHFILRCQRGQLVAFVQGVESWSLPCTVAVGEVRPVRWQSPEAQQAWGAGANVEVKATDELVVCGEPVFFCHWDEDGLVGQIIFQGPDVFFDGQGDRTRVGGHDYVNIFSPSAFTDGLHYYEFDLKRIVCNVEVGVAAIDGPSQSQRYRSGSAVSFPTWKARFKPQYRVYDIQSGRTTHAQLKAAPENCTVGLLVDMSKAAMVWLMDGEVIGEPILNMPATLCLFASLDTEGDHIAVRQPTPPSAAMKRLEPLPMTQGVRDWLCGDCLTRYKKQDEVQRWKCRSCGVDLCESCRLGMGRLPDGSSSLALAAWLEPGVLDEESSPGFQLLLERRCWSRGQLVESMVMATLGNHGRRVLHLLFELKRRDLSDLSFDGRFAMREALGACKSQEGKSEAVLQRIAEMALLVGLYTAQPLAVDAILVFQKKSSTNAPVASPLKDSTEDQAQSPQNSDEEVDSDMFESECEESGDEQEMPKEPWFRCAQLPPLIGALSSYCATGKELQRHVHDVYPAPNLKERTCACGARADMACATCNFGQCRQCFYLAERPLTLQHQDCCATISKLLSEDPSSINQKLPRNRKFSPQPGDFMISESMECLLYTQVFVLERAGAPLKPIPCRDKDDLGEEPGLASSDEESEVEEDPVRLKPSGMWDDDDSEEETAEDLDQELLDTAQFGHNPDMSAQPLLQFQRKSTAFHLAAASASPSFLQLLLEHREETQEHEVVFDQPNQDHSIEPMNKAIKEWVRSGVLNGSDIGNCVFAFDAQHHFQWLNFLDELTDEQYPVRLVCAPNSLSFRSASGDTALHVAACANQTAQLKLLLEHKADPRVRNDRGVTPLMYALKVCGEEAALMLISATAKFSPQALDVIDSTGTAPPSRGSKQRSPTRTCSSPLARHCTGVRRNGRKQQAA
ncbi:unnamed protein product [Effrenium voratum]|uniref:Uncharacterized protein n=1 Tax=Effrenium voratum TaxID=2562239 RepID=A0AA36ML56_9DINO|nr:unnamed protein product [Effrenium voratum]